MLLFDVLMCWIHKFQDKIFILNLLLSVLRVLVNISYKLLWYWTILSYTLFDEQKTIFHILTACTWDKLCSSLMNDHNSVLST